MCTFSIYELIYTITISYATYSGFFASLDYNTECQDAVDHPLTDMSLCDSISTFSICGLALSLILLRSYHWSMQKERSIHLI